MIGKNHVWSTFNTPESLATHVVGALAELKATVQVTESVSLSRRRDFYKLYSPTAELCATSRPYQRTAACPAG
jgi:hypothetical protein